jgi:hypothetical protein
VESDTLPRMPARKHYQDAWDIMRLRLPPGTCALIEGAARKGESRTDLIRRAIEAELQRREAGAAKSKTKKK